MSIGWNWPGLKGQHYKFSLWQIPVVLPQKSGVYIISRKVTGGFAPLYVGEAGDLFDRLNTGASAHEGLERASRLGATHIGYLLAGPAERLRIETELRHSLNPPCNKQSVPVNALSLFDIANFGK
ncbi:hypothetical protein [Sinisalibacter aestuarii]|uniref:GIY-YIG domain-containing protein n=1 Tax=Sinisalibacter aestuarii TaxID=2949426 RepID=A0ABQ5LVB3_9RHOB|nr:hypothetical protein [Sinisalibacter aestuarii]GKY88922.1 hypothetical protein STA1M1_27910 [Sinisalibacter aestuarii]